MTPEEDDEGPPPEPGTPDDVEGFDGPGLVPDLTMAQARRILHMTAWKGPWEYLACFLYGVRGDCTLRWKVRDGSLLDRLAAFCDGRDIAWHRRHFDNGTRPLRAWKRR